MAESGEILGINVNAVVDVIMIGTGLLLIYKWFKNCKGTCSHCNSCGSQHKKIGGSMEKNINYPAMLAMGMCYGASPCAPLILMLGYCETLPAIYAVLIGLVFSVTSALSPTIIVILLSGGLANKFRNEIHGLIKWFQLACYSVLIILSVWNLIKTL